VEVIMLIKVAQHRSFPIGEGDEGWGLLNRIVVVQECDAMEAK